MPHGPPEPVSDRVPNLAPMVDVIMVILIFFMLGASLNLTKEGVLRTELDPRSGPGPGTAVEIITSVRIGLQDVAGGQGCNIYVMGEPLAGNSFPALHQFLQSRRQAGADPANPVVIESEPGVRWQFVVSAVDAAVRASFDNVQFAVHLSGEPR